MSVQFFMRLIGVERGVVVVVAKEMVSGRGVIFLGR